MVWRLFGGVFLSLFGITNSQAEIQVWELNSEIFSAHFAGSPANGLRGNLIGSFKYDTEANTVFDVDIFASVDPIPSDVIDFPPDANKSFGRYSAGRASLTLRPDGSPNYFTFFKGANETKLKDPRLDLFLIPEFRGIALSFSSEVFSQFGNSLPISSRTVGPVSFRSFFCIGNSDNGDPCSGGTSDLAPRFVSARGELTLSVENKPKVAVLFLLPASGAIDDNENAAITLKEITENAIAMSEADLEVDYFKGLGTNLLLQLAATLPDVTTNKINAFLSLSKKLKAFVFQQLDFQRQVAENTFTLFRATSPSSESVKLTEDQILSLTSSSEKEYDKIVVIAYSTSTQEFLFALFNLIAENKISADDASKFSVIFIAPTASSRVFSDGTYTLEQEDQIATAVSSLMWNAKNLASDNSAAKITWLDVLGHDLIRSYIKPEAPDSEFVDTRIGKNGVETNIIKAVEAIE